jgi:hypothetical protein
LRASFSDLAWTAALTGGTLGADLATWPRRPVFAVFAVCAISSILDAGYPLEQRLLASHEHARDVTAQDRDDRFQPGETRRGLRLDQRPLARPLLALLVEHAAERIMPGLE